MLAILRREGYRVPHAADRPLRPRAHQLQPVERGAAWLDATAVRRAGLLVAAASVLGAAAITDGTGGDRADPSVIVPEQAPGHGGTGVPPVIALLGPNSPGAPLALTAFAGPGGLTGPVAPVQTSAFPSASALPGGSAAAPGAGEPGV
ncbi:MAG: hypothetical protein AB7V44_29010, partial [Pseudonocardia sp.]